MARAAATGIRLGPLVKLLRPRGCGAGSSAGTGSAAGWLPPSPWVRTGSAAGWRLQSPWVRSSPCLFRTVCSFLDTASQLTGLAPSAVGPSRRSGRAWGSHRNDRKCRYAGSQLAQPGSALNNVRLTPLGVVASLHYRKGLKPSANHRSRAGDERSERPGRNCGDRAPTVQRVMS